MSMRASPAATWAALAALVIPASAVGCAGRGAAAGRAGEHDAAYQIRMARSLLNGGRVNEALSTLNEAIEADPDNASLHNYYGQICLVGGRLDEAEEALRQALEIDPGLTDAHNNLGTVLMEQGDPSAAEEEFRLALADPVYPTPEKVYLNLGLLYRTQGREAEALEALRRSVEIDPRYYRAHYELAALLERSGRVAEAAREYEVAEPGHRASGEYWYRRGMAYYRLGDRQKALDSLNRVRVVAPGSESAARADELLDIMN
jgi:type IV pilus biogenesis/stability protein PilW